MKYEHVEVLDHQNGDCGRTCRICRDEKVRTQYGEDAKVVKPYSPNRKQRRAQAARLRGK